MPSAISIAQQTLSFRARVSCTIKFVGEDGQVIEHEVFDAPSSGVAMAMYNLDREPRSSNT